MTYKRPCLPAANDYNNSLCDYYGYGETRVLNSTIDLNFPDVVTSKLKKLDVSVQNLEVMLTRKLKQKVKIMDDNNTDYICVTSARPTYRRWF